MENVTPFESAAELRSAHDQLLGAFDALCDTTTDSEQGAVRDHQEQIFNFILRASATGSCIADMNDRTASQTMMDYWASVSRSAGLQPPRTRLARFDPERLPALADAQCPYVGLESFQSSTYFFGRNADSLRLVERITAQPIVVVRGASGSGKSSLLLGGALPRLRAAQPWLVSETLVPGDDPIERLVACLAPLLPLPRDFSGAIQQDPSFLRVDRTILLVIDQFEEVFTLGSVEERALLDLSLASVLEAGHKVVLTVREEFHTRLVSLPRLQPWLSRDGSDFPIRTMGQAELVEAIEGPAALVNLVFERGIATELANAVLGQPAALPLLQFALRELWNQRDRNRITRDVYQKVGNPLDALARSADRFYLGLVPQTRAEVERVLTALVRVNELLEAYRQPVRRTTLLAAGVAETPSVLTLLEGKEFICFRPSADPNDVVVQVKHEALLRNWPRFVEWIDARRRERRRYFAVSEMAAAWDRAGRPADGLLRGWQLDEAREWVGIPPLEKEFLDASKEAVTRVAREKEAVLRQAAADASAAADRARQEAARTEELLEQERWLTIRLRMQVAMGLFGLVVALLIAGLLWYKFRELQKEEEDFLERAEATTAETNQRIQQLEDENRRLQQGQASNFATGVGNVVQSIPEAATNVRPLARPAASPLIFLHISSEEDREAAQRIQTQLLMKGIQVSPTINAENSVPVTKVCYHRPEDFALAQSIANLMQTNLGVDSIQALPATNPMKVPDGQLDIWFSANVLNHPLPAPLPSLSTPE